MNFDRSVLRARSPRFFSTKASSIVTVSPERSVAEKLTSSSTRSITVCSRLRADILDRRIDLGGDIGERVDAVLAEIERHAFGREQRLVLLDEARFGLGEDAAQIVAGERLEFDADRQAALQFGQEIGRLGDDGKRPRR